MRAIRVNEFTDTDTNDSAYSAVSAAAAVSSPAFPKLWVATHKWVAKLWQVDHQSLLDNLIFFNYFSNHQNFTLHSAIVGGTTIFVYVSLA